MIRQIFRLDKYDWRVKVYYAVSCYYTEEIITELRNIGCRGLDLAKAVRNLSACDLDTGLTYSNHATRQTVMVIGMTSSPEEFQDSFDHEKGHLRRHIEKAFGIDPFSEEDAYLSGDIGKKMFPVARRFLCECHSLYI